MVFWNKTMEINIWFLFSFMKTKTHLKKYVELWSKIRDLFRSLTNNSDDCDQKNMEIKLNSGDDLPSNKMQKLHNMAVFGRSAFQKCSKYYLHFS